MKITYSLHLSLRKFLLTILVFLCFKTPAQLSSVGIHFDGSYDVVHSVAAGFQIGNSDFTYESWIRSERETWVIQMEIPFSNSDASDTGFRMYLIDGQIGARLDGPFGYQSNYPAGPDLRDSACHHIAFTRKGDTTRVYVDGNVVSTEVWPMAYIGINNAIDIGNSSINPFYAFKGLIKEVRLWLSARTQSQLQTNMNVVLNPAANPTLVAYWRCNEGTGQAVNDIAGNSEANFGLYLSTETADPYWDYGCPACTGPGATITANGPLTFCSGGNVELKTGYSINKSYQWLKDNVNIVGATSNKYHATASGKYKVMVSDLISGCYKLTGIATTVKANPLTIATVTPAGPISFCIGDSIVLKANTLSGATYQWKKGVNLIASATKKTYKAKSAGNYRVIVTDTNGCSATSSPVAVSTPCRNSLINADVELINIYPNPSSDYFNIEINEDGNNILSIEVYDITGKKVDAIFKNTSGNLFLIERLDMGIYSLVVRFDNEVRNYRLVKI